MSGTRQVWIDAWKGHLIFLVVLGHMAGGLSHGCTGSAQTMLEFVYKLIYIFHMPAFFFLAGYVGSKAGFIKKVKRLLVPYAVWGVTSVLIYLALQGVSIGLKGNYYSSHSFEGVWWQPFVSLVHAGGWPNGEGFRCNSVLWFLPVMFVVCVLRPYLRGGWVMMCGAFVLGGVLCLHCSVSLPWGLSLAPFYFGFYLLGEEVRHWKFEWKGWIIALAWVVYVGVTYLLPNMYWAYSTWSGYLFGGVVMAALGCILSLMTARMSFASLSPWPVLGIASLGIMVTHKFLVMAAQVVLSRATLSNGCVAAVVALALSALIVALTVGVTAVVRRVAPWTIGEV